MYHYKIGTILLFSGVRCEVHSAQCEIHGAQHDAVADLRGAQGTCTPPRFKFFQFHAVFGKIWQNRMLVPPGELVPPPRGNPGSATVMCMHTV